MSSIISIVTPSFNQAEFIADTIESILSQQGDFYIDYIIIDGASTDGTRDIIIKYENVLKEKCRVEKIVGLDFYVTKGEFRFNRCKGISYRWVSEKDKGHGDALNKGFSVAKGDILCWLNSDDMYHQQAFQTITEIFEQFDHVKWITGLNSIWNKDGTQRQITYLGKCNYKNIYSFLTGDYEFIQQESTFWRRDLWERAGAKINTDYKFMVDGELWCRFFLYETLFHVQRELGGYRHHDTNRAHRFMPQVNAEMKKAINFLRSKASKGIRDIAENLSDNAPIRELQYEGIDFRIIDKKPGNSGWQISEVDFFIYSCKRNASRIRNLQRSIVEGKKDASAGQPPYMNKLQEKDEMIKMILNSKQYKVGKFLLSPFNITRLLFRKIENTLITIGVIVKKCTKKETWKSLAYPLWLDWNKITTPDKYIFISYERSDAFLRYAVNAIIKEEPYLPFSVYTNFLFVKSMIRPDYNDFYNKVFRQCNEDKELIDITYSSKKKKERKLILLIKLLWYLPIFFKLFDFDFRVSLYRYLKAISYIRVLKIMKAYEFKVLVAFADMQGVENMLVQYFRKKGKQTVTLQHGLYVDYTAYDNINRVNYESMVSSYFLAWGDETKELIQRHHPSVAIIICGKPLYMQIPANKQDYFTLIFDQKLFTDQNKELLIISQHISRLSGLKVNVRLHPWDLKNRYDFDADTLFDQDITSSRFVIGHTTSMIFECMRNGIPAFKYKTKFPSNVVNDSLTFSNESELMDKIEKISTYDFADSGKYYLKYVGDESLQQYADFFQRISNQGKNKRV